MEIIHSLQELPHSVRWVFAIGFFDGIHKGHQRVIDAAAELAAKHQAQLGVITFYPHPLAVLEPVEQPPLLQSEEEKMECFRCMGIHLVIILKPTAFFLKQPPVEFLKSLESICCLKGLSAGENFTFGAGARGNPKLMKQYFSGKDVEIREVPLLRSPVLQGEPVSSTAIRMMIRQGEVDQASLLLGRLYSLQGIVAEGAGRGGAALGFPTANLSPQQNYVYPGDGVYAGWADVEHGHRYPAVINIGTNPTFRGSKRTVETHILGYRGNLYGTSIRVFFVKKIRGEICFSSMEALKSQIGTDIQTAENILDIHEGKMPKTR